ncbi:1-acyl-sn-glycerol-3-phosphate acyltransferase [Candidatus Nomurabacteria bacterium]|nr:1-acyl-sn-glycerol-3-phosphate acyltransferase [Candidatus Nomurabacteria bacterium]
MYFLLRFLFYLPIKLLWRVKINNQNNIPDGNFILAANHNSYLDFIILFILFPRRISFLAAEKFFSSKIWKPIMEMTGQIKVDRNSHNKNDVYVKVGDVLRSGGVLGIFPEGTRSRNGCIGKAYSGVAKFAHEYNIPVLPIGIEGTFLAWPPENRFPKFKKCKINIGKVFFVRSQDFNKETIKIMKTISGLCGQTYDY